MTGNASLDLAAAERALEVVPADPIRARNEAELVLAGPALDAEAASVAHRVVGLVDREVGRFSQARDHLCTSIEIAEGSGLAVRAAAGAHQLGARVVAGG